MMIVGGRLRSKKGEAIAGGRVEVIDLDSGGVIAYGFSDVRGNFRLPVSRVNEAHNEKGFAIQVVGQGNRLLVDRVRMHPATENVVAIDLKPPPNRLRNFRPATPLLRRLTGSVLDADVLPMLDSAVGLIIPKSEPGYNRFVRVVRHCVPALARFESVLDDAWMVLDGDQSATQRLRRALGFFSNLAGNAPRISSALFNIQPRDQSSLFPVPLPDNGFPIPEPGGPARSCALPVDRLLPILTATLRIATDVEDESRLLTGLDASLSGIRQFELLNGLAQETLSSGNPAPLSDELSRLAVEMSITDDGPFEGGLDWPYPPPDRTPPLPFDFCENLRTGCLHSFVNNWRLQRALNFSNPLQYQITSVQSNAACPGDIVIIQGSNFGSIPGQILFPDRQGGSFEVDPRPGTWTNTRIEAVVPAQTGSGVIRLSILEASMGTCAGAVSVYRAGNGFPFHTGAPYVSSVTINGKAAGSVVQPDSVFTVAWTSPGPDDVFVVFREERGNFSAQRSSGLFPANGSTTFRTLASAPPGKIVVEVYALENNCGPEYMLQAEAEINCPARILRIEGMEITQGIQTFSLQGGPRNTLSTIRNKDTIVRVYVVADCGGPLRGAVSQVTGLLWIDGHASPLSPINGITPDRPGGGNPFITARSLADIDRTQTNHTLNFRIPAALSSLTKQIRVVVFGPGPLSTQPRASTSMTWTWESKSPLIVRFVRIKDDRPAPTGTGTLPTEPEAHHSIERAFDLLPTPATDIAPAWHVTHSLSNINGTPTTLATELHLIHNQVDPVSEGVQPVTWVGLVDVRLPGGLGRAFLNPTGSFGTCVSLNYRDNRDHQGIFRIVTAHEIAHTLRAFCHVDDPTCSLPYASPTTSLAEVVFDPYWNEAVFPATDVMMSFGTPGVRYWISPALWNFLISSSI